MRGFRRVAIGLSLVFVTGWFAPRLALGQPVPGANTTDWSLVGTSSWNTAGNWTLGVPDVNTEDFGVINNGGTATLNTAAAAQAGGVSLGTAGGESGTLDIQSGGSLTVVDDTFGFLSDGSVRIGQGGTGTLFVRPGGSLSALSLTLGAASSTSSLTLGGTSAGTTTVSTGSASLGRTTRVTGPNVNFTATGNLTLQGTSTLIAGITGTSHSPLKTTTTAIVAGTLRPEFTGYSPIPGNRWNIIDAANISGQFVLDLTGAPALGTAQTYFVQQRAGGTNGQLLQLGVEQLLTAQVNWDTKAISIKNTGTSPVTLDSYSILSQLGSLDPTPGKWTSLADAATPGWTEAGPTTKALNELNTLGSMTINAGETKTLGAPFNPQIPATFGVSPEDIQLRYSNTAGEVFNGLVEYSGQRDTNNLRLTIDPATGQGQIRNEGSVSVALEGYTIHSGTANLLTGWNSLHDQNVSSGAWQEAGASTSDLSELNQLASTTIGPNAGYNLGNVWNTSGTQKLDFVFQLLNESTTRIGTVIFGTLPSLATSLAGDYNGNGVVDAADFTIWRDTFGSTTDLRANGDNTGGSAGKIDIADFNIWKTNFGMHSGAGGGGLGSGTNTVPEPSTWMLAVLTVGLFCVFGRFVAGNGRAGRLSRGKRAFAYNLIRN